MNGVSAAADKAAVRLVANDGNAVEGNGVDGDTVAHNMTEDASVGALDGLSPDEFCKALLSTILTELEDDKAEDVVAIPLAGKSDIADHMVIASGRSQRHVSAMADKIARRLKADGFGRAHIEGASTADWVLIDAGDVIVHIFRPEVRSFYNLERVWSEAAHVPVKADA